MEALHLLNSLEGRVPFKRLMYIDARVCGKTSRVIIDMGASHNFESIGETNRLGLKVSKDDDTVKVVNYGV